MYVYSKGFQTNFETPYEYIIYENEFKFTYN